MAVLNRFSAILRVGSWQSGFFADSHFWAAGFFCGFSRRILSPQFCGEKVPLRGGGGKSSRKSPAKSSKIYTTKIPRGAGPTILLCCNSTHFFVLLAGSLRISGDSRPAILGIVRFAILCH